MNWRFYLKPDYSDGEIDLIPIRLSPADRGLEFGKEWNWRITEHGKRQEIGRVSYRAGESRGIYFFGHIGYHIDPPWRGRHFALKACQLISEEIIRSGKTSVIITCDPDNVPSRKTCMGLGCLWESEVDVDRDLQERYEISACKERYIWMVGKTGRGHV